jgi:cytochrome b561
MVEVMGLNKHSDYTPLTRWLHAGLALGAVYQLATSLILFPPDEQGSTLGHAMMEAHELSGLLIVAIVTTHFIWSLFVRAKHPSSLGVLVSRSQWKKAFSHIPIVPSALIGKTAATQLLFCKIEQTLIFLSGEELHAHHRTG